MHRLSRSTRAAAREAEALDQEGEGTAQQAERSKHGRVRRAEEKDTETTKVPDQENKGAAKQAKRSRVRVKEHDKDMETTTFERTDSSARGLAGLTESQAAADTLAKVGFRLPEHALHGCMYVCIYV